MRSHCYCRCPSGPFLELGDGAQVARDLGWSFCLSDLHVLEMGQERSRDKRTTCTCILTNREVLAVRCRPNRHLHVSVATHGESFVGLEGHHFLLHHLLPAVSLTLTARGWSLSDLVDCLHARDLRRMRVGLGMRAD